VPGRAVAPRAPLVARLRRMRGRARKGMGARVRRGARARARRAPGAREKEAGAARRRTRARPTSWAPLHRARASGRGRPPAPPRPRAGRSRHRGRSPSPTQRVGARRGRGRGRRGALVVKRGINSPIQTADAPAQVSSQSPPRDVELCSRLRRGHRRRGRFFRLGASPPGAHRGYLSTRRHGDPATLPRLPRLKARLTGTPLRVTARPPPARGTPK
jgi:hypothetical protein